MAFQLRIQIKDEAEKIVPLADGDTLIGRSRSAQIQLSPLDVSGRHLMLHVDKDSVIAENLSSHGARTAQTAIELPTPIRPGDTIFLGRDTSVRLETVRSSILEKEVEKTMISDDAELTILGDAPHGIPSGVTPEPDSGKTFMDKPSAFESDKTDPGEAPCPVCSADVDRTILDEPAAVAKKPDASRTVLNESIAESEIRKTVAAGSSDAFKTNAMQTRIASAEEIDFLRRQDRKRKRDKKLKYVLGIVGLIVLLAAVYWFQGRPPEEKLTWPLTEKGMYSEKPFEPGEGGFDAGRFSVIAPLVPSTEGVREKNGDLVITTRTGRDRDVPMRIVLSVKRSSAYLHEERLKTFNDWIAEISASGGHWNFGQVSDLFFLGKNNGLPCLGAVYSRESENQSWYGEVLFFRNGDERIVRMAEIPSSERLRGTEFLSSNPFLFTSEKFVENHWEGAPEIYSGNPADLLNEAKGLLVKMSPATWDKIFMLLRSVLVAATESGDRELKEQALEQLRKLRDSQRVWYNAQCIAYLKEKSAGNERAANIIRDSCLSVFSCGDDLRNRNIKRNIWE